MGFEFAPYNFWYFLIFFSLSLGMSIYVLVSYRRHWLILLNALMFFLCAIKFAIEYFIHQVDAPSELHVIRMVNGPVSFTLTSIFGLSVFFTIRPFKKSKFENTLNAITALIGLGIPQAIIWVQHFRDKIFYFLPEKINGIWYAGIYDTPFVGYFKVYSLLFSAVVFFLLFLLSLFREKEYRFRKIFAMLIFILFPLVYAQIWDVDNEAGAFIPNWGLSFFVEAIAIYWFVAGYSILRNQYDDALDDISNSITELIIRTDKTLNILNMNNAALKIIGSSHSNLREALSTMTTEQNPNAIDGLLQHTSSSVSLSLNKQNKTIELIGRVRPYHWRGQKLGYSFAFNDVTDLKHKEAQLEEANNTKDLLFSILAHDLRKPALSFRSISKKINYLLAKRDFDSLDKLGDSIEKSAIGLNHLLDNLLNWSLTQKDMLRVNIQSISISTVINEAINSVNMLAQDKNISISYQDDTSMSSLDTDPDILMTVIRNLVDSTIKEVPEHSMINIVSTHANELISISISSENGEMSAGIQSTMKSINSEQDNMNLSLNLVKELISKINGQIFIENNMEKGSSVQLFLPHKI